MIKKIIVVLGFSLFVVNTFAQLVDYKQFYFSGKNFYREGRYNLAMESFKKAIPYDQTNPFSEYASFYFALSAYHQGYLAVAKDMLGQIKALYPKWDKLDEVTFWQARIMIDNKDYFQGLKLLSTIQSNKIQPDIDALKTQTVSKIEDKETLRMMFEEYPKDAIVSQRLAKVLSRDLSAADDRSLLESIITQFQLTRTTYIPEAPKTYFKDTYAVATLFPFQVATLEPTNSRKKNQLVIDLYEGMKMAIDTLAKLGVKISLRAYDTEQNPDKIRNILATPELQSADVIVGPLYSRELKPVQEFSLNRQINMINPLSNNSEMLTQNNYSFLFQPSWETMGKNAGKFLGGYVARKNCLVYYGVGRFDSLLANNFVREATANGIKVVSQQMVTKETAGKILTQLTTPTEYDEFKYPSQFTLKKDSIGSIFVASDDPLIYTKVIGGVETRGDSIVVIGTENWLETAPLEKYQRLGVVLAAPNYINYTSMVYRAFEQKFIRIHGRTPNRNNSLGYEFMLFTGLQLKKNGVYFQDGLAQESFVPGILYQGYNFQFTRDNQVVPFVKVVNGELQTVR